MKLILSAIFIMLLSTAAYAESFEVVSIDKDFQMAVLKETLSGQNFSVRLGDIVSDYRIEGITQNFVTVSKLQKGTILLVRLPVPKQTGKKCSNNTYQSGKN